MILEPGHFNVRDFRKDIPLSVKLAVMIRQKACDEQGVPFEESDATKINFDHRPALNARQFDTEANDFIPPQLDPAKIFAIRKSKHDERTFGRKDGAERTVTTRGSDVGEAARIKRIQSNDAVFRASMASKAGDYVGAAQILATAPKLPRTKRKIFSRPFPPSKRKLRWRA